MRELRNKKELGKYRYLEREGREKQILERELVSQCCASDR